jgi:ketosteroid isomerase-like protein
MSQENVEIVRQVFDAVARRDAKGVLALYDPNVELDQSHTEFAELVGDAIYRGHDGLRSFDREWREAFEDIETRCEELIDVGEQVVSVARYYVRGRTSGIEVPGHPHAGVWTIRNGKVVRVVWFNTRGEALEAAGLSEQDAHADS